MNIRKLIPIVIAILLFILAVLLFIKNNNNKAESFDKLIVTYNGSVAEVKDLEVNKTFSVGNSKLYVIAMQKRSVVLNSDSTITDNGKEASEVEVIYNHEKEICVSNNTCFKVTLK